jgi:RHS repeat-associated protein
VADGIVTKYYYAGTQRIAFRKAEALYFVISDYLGSTSIVTDANGTVVSETKYKAWGEIRQNTGTSPTNYTYTGQYSYTTGFGLMFYNARWYDPSLRRFAQADTIIPGGVQGYDRFAYAANNPLRYIDPTGHRNCEEDGYNCPGNSKANINAGRLIGWWTGSSRGYKGSGWAHGPRRAIASLLDRPKTASNLGEFLVASLLHEDSVTITGPLLEDLKRDPAIKSIQEKTMAIVINNKDFGSRPITSGEFYYPEVGGERATGKLWYVQPETLQVALNPLTWTLRHFTLGVRYFADENKDVQITYTAYDIANLRVEGDRSSSYDRAVTRLGFYWHEVLGGNDQMEVYASWTSSNPMVCMQVNYISP